MVNNLELAGFWGEDRSGNHFIPEDIFTVLKPNLTSFEAWIGLPKLWAPF